MGLSFSSMDKLNPCSTSISNNQPPNRELENPLAPNDAGIEQDSRSTKEGNSVYYRDDEDPTQEFKRLLNEAELKELQDKRVIEITVCKMKLAGHWFIAIYLADNLHCPLELHYVDIGSVLIYCSDRNFAGIRQSRYSPIEGTTFGMVAKECFEFVARKPYGILTNSCQDFVTEMMTKFTNRQINSYFKNIKIPVICFLSAPFSTKKVVTVLEKEFLDECRSKGVREGITFLDDTNSDIEDILNKQDLFEVRYNRKKIAFLRKVLCPLKNEDNENYLPEFYKFMKKQTKEIAQEINEEALKAWRLANFLIITESENLRAETDLMSLEQALDQYRYKL